MKRGIITLLIIGIIFCSSVQLVLSEESQNKYSNKFNPQLIEYIQNNSVNVQTVQKSNNLFSVSSSAEQKIPVIISLYNQNQINKTDGENQINGERKNRSQNRHQHSGPKTNIAEIDSRVAGKTMIFRSS